MNIYFLLFLLPSVLCQSIDSNTIISSDSDGLNSFISDQPPIEALIQSTPETPSQDILNAIVTLHNDYEGHVIVNVNRGTQTVDMVEIINTNNDTNNDSNNSTGSRRLLTTATTLTPEEKAALWFKQYGSIFGMSVGTMNGLTLLSNNIDNTTGHVHLIYEQYVDNIPVFGGRMNVHFDSTVSIAAVNGNYIRDYAPVNTTASLSSNDAIIIAKRFLTKLKYDNLNATENETFDERMSNIDIYTNTTLMIFRYGLLQNVPGSSVLTYKIILFSPRLRHIVYVNAHTGDIVEEYPDKHEVLTRTVQRYDKATSKYITVWNEGQAPTGNIQYDNMVTIAGFAYNFFGTLTKGSWLSFDGQDARMISVLDPDSALQSCPNAYFDGTQAVFCNNVVSDDVVAHEWGHGYTGYTSGLVYKYQQGAMNEAYSDIWGETIDMIDNFGTDSPSNIRTTDACVSDYRTNVRWMVGEDASAFGGPIRDMWNPECKGNPGKVTSAYYRCSTSDNGGVHSNSGVVNRFYSLIVDGGTFNGQTVNGIGYQKAAHLMWQVTRYYLTAVSAFPALASSLPSACRDLVGIPLPNLLTTGLSTWSSAGTGSAMTTSDCQQVDKAATAVEFRLQPNCNFGYVINTASYPLCPISTQINYDIFFDDFESKSLSTQGWSTTSVGVSGSFNRRTWVPNRLSDGREGNGAFASAPNVGNCGSDDQSGVYRLVSRSITVPNDAGGIRVSFEHYYATEPDFDGGNVQIEINGGAPTVVPKSNFLYNGYPYTLATTSPGYNTNPMRGQPAFAGSASSGGPQGAWVRSVIDLSSLVKVGDTFKISFQMGTDGCGGVLGWYIDDVRVYWCGTDYCAANPCFNGGTCTNSATTASRTCTCAPGFSGPDCSTITSQVRTYSWNTGTWNTTCSATCGSGVVTRTVVCKDDLNNIVDDNFCLTAAPTTSKPATTQSCNTQPCVTYSWTYGDWSACSVTCGTGTQTRTVSCKSSIGGIVSNSFCTDPQDITSRACTLSACPVYVWSYGSWNTCTKTCGSGIQTRVATCVNQVNNVPTTADQCSGQVLQSTSQSCNTRACATWQYSDWSTCSVTCGGGAQTRTATCALADGTILTDTTECGTRDILTRTCNEAACITYAWRTGTWNDCSSPCGSGIQTRTVECVGSNAAVSADNTLCTGESPVTQQSCNTSPCRTYQWVYGAWGTCDVECGTGTRTRTLQCQDDTGNVVVGTNCASSTPLQPVTEPCNSQPCVSYSYQYSDWTTCPVTCGGATQTRAVSCVASTGIQVNMSRCTGTPDITSRPCNTQTCITYQWRYGAWGTCSVTCGGGTQTRQYGCIGSDGQTATSEALCTDQLAATSRPCATQPCITYSWQYGNWSTCSTACGIGSRSRTATCVSSTGETVASTLCTSTQDALTSTCTGTTCPTTTSVGWFVTSWTACDVTCGGGTMRRVVYCLSTTSYTIMDESLCTANSPKPAITQTCNTTPCSNTQYNWYAFSWGRCSANCNSGTQSRTVVCVDNSYRIYANSYCDPATKPAVTQSCNTNSCSRRWLAAAWNSCSASCGGGNQTRSVSCIDDTTSATLSESECVDLIDRPVDMQACNTQSCPIWSDESWGTCSKACGGGIQTRSTPVCKDFTGATVDNSQCTSVLPITTRLCSTQACPTYSWRTSDWASCSTPCGGGIQTRTVQCIKSNNQIWPDVYCASSGNKPDIQQICNTNSCTNVPYIGQWWSSVWYSCNNGTQVRDVLCINSSYYQIDQQNCNPSTRPSTSQNC